MQPIGVNIRSIFVATIVAVAAASLALAFGVARAQASFGFADLDGQWTADTAGHAYTQAGGHPFAVTTVVSYNRHEDPTFHGAAPDAMPKDVITSLPAGLVGNPSAAGTCTWEQFVQPGLFVAECPVSSQVGFTVLDDAGYTIEVPLYNLQAPSRVPARLAFNLVGVPVVLDASVRSGGDYGLDINTLYISEALPLSEVRLTVWGTPADPAHDGQRCREFHFAEEANVENFCTGTPGEPFNGPNSAGLPPVPYMTLPTRCTAPGVGLETRVRMDSWKEPGVFVEGGFLTHEAPAFPAEPAERGPQVGVTGCESVPFEPSVHAALTASAPSTPTGLNVDLSVPTGGLESTTGLAQSDVKKVVMRFPEGMMVNPADANGLGSCSEAQVALGSSSDASCPEDSQLGTVTIRTPLLKEPMTGALYQAAQGANPFGSVLAVYLVAKGSGVVVKLPGRVDADPSTGQLTVSFDNAPQLPFASMELSLPAGPRAVLVTPGSCGEKAIVTELTGWSGKTVTTSSPFTVACTPGVGGFAPSFVAGTTSNRAGGFSPYVLSFSRSNSEQPFSGLTTALPPGVLAKLAGVPRCSDADAGAGTCPAASRLGGVTVGSGAGSIPLFLQGSVYLTGPYNGGPFGVAVVVPAVAGPFDLGNVVVRGSIRIDPRTAQASVVSDAFPQFIGSTGIPTSVRRVDVNLDRPGYTFNATNCSPLNATGTLTGLQGAVANLASRYQAADCGALAFNPSFTASTNGRTSKLGGASLTVKVGYPSEGEANIAAVRVSLPARLPSRLETLKLACTEAVFAANPASCPEGSNVGSATATTPVLAGPLTGPAYLVSHGGAAFPDLEIVLQGEGVTIVLDGKTDIKHGITTSSFDAVPDAPIGSFQLTLPQGPHSILAAPGGNLCSRTLRMPTTIQGQNGALIEKTTKIAVTGCAKHKHRHAKKKRKHHHKHN